MNRLLFATLIALVILAALALIIWTGQHRMIYFPLREVPSPEAMGLRGAETVTFATEDGLTLHGWFVPAARLPAPFTIIVFNGNGANRAYRAPLASALRARGYSVLLFDYRGYGENRGEPSESGLAADARAARAYLVTRRDVDPARLVYFGESLGSAVATRLAAEHPPAALILRSPFSSLADVGQFHYPVLPVRLLLRHRFEPIDHIDEVRAPVLVLLGDRDRIVPPAHSRRLYDAAREPKRLVVIEGADHNDVHLLEGPEMIDAVVEFLQTVVRGE